MESARHGILHHLGAHRSDDQWRQSTSNKKFPGLFSAARFVGEQHLGLSSVTSVRFGVGLKHLSALPHVVAAVTILWRPGRGSHKTIDQEADTSGGISAIRLGTDFEGWENLRDDETD